MRGKLLRSGDYGNDHIEDSAASAAENHRAN
jgi:hypothetical protein